MSVTDWRGRVKENQDPEDGGDLPIDENLPAAARRGRCCGRCFGRTG